MSGESTYDLTGGMLPICVRCVKLAQPYVAALVTERQAIFKANIMTISGLLDVPVEELWSCHASRGCTAAEAMQCSLPDCDTLQLEWQLVVCLKLQGGAMGGLVQ